MKFDRRLTDEIYTSDTVRLGKWYVLHCDDSKNKGEVFYYDLQKAIWSTV